MSIYTSDNREANSGYRLPYSQWAPHLVLLLHPLGSTSIARLGLLLLVSLYLQCWVLLHALFPDTTHSTRRLYGITVLQSVRYFSSARKDTKYMRVVVGQTPLLTSIVTDTLLRLACYGALESRRPSASRWFYPTRILDTFHLLCISDTMYTFLVTDFADFLAVIHPPWSLGVSVNHTSCRVSHSRIIIDDCPSEREWPLFTRSCSTLKTHIRSL